MAIPPRRVPRDRFVAGGGSPGGNQTGRTVPAAHTHLEVDITDLDKYSQAAADAKFLMLDASNDPMTAQLEVPSILSDFVQFDITFADGTAEGKLQWNSEDGTLEVGLPGGNVNLQIGQELVIRCRNETGVTITNGSIVYIIGASGNKPLIALADASSDTTADVLGFATEEILHNANGYVALQGLVRDVDTSGMVAGDVIFLSETAGEFTDVRPTPPAIGAHVGHVMAVHASTGVVYATIFEHTTLAHEVSDVLIASVASLELLQWTGSVWENKTLAEAGISATGHTHLEADITDLDKYSVAAADAAFAPISHTHLEAQITDLQAYLVSPLTTNGDVLYYNAGHQRLPKGSDTEVLTLVAGLPAWVASGSGVTDHGALTGLLDDDHTQYAKLTGATFTGEVDFTSSNTRFTHNDPAIIIKQAGGAVDEKIWRLLGRANQLQISTLNDAETVTAVAMRFSRNGASPNLIEMFAPLDTTGNITIDSSSFAMLQLDGAASDAFVAFADTGTDKYKMGYDFSAAAWKLNAGASFTPAHMLMAADGKITVSEEFGFNIKANAITTVRIGESSTLRGNSQDGRLIFYGEQSGAIGGMILAHSGTNLQFSSTAGASNIQFVPDARVEVITGKHFRIRDSTNADIADWSHDGSDFLIDFTNTRDYIFSGLTRSVEINGGATATDPVLFLRRDDQGATRVELFRSRIDTSTKNPLFKIEAEETGNYMNLEVSSSTGGTAMLFSGNNNDWFRATNSGITPEVSNAYDFGSPSLYWKGCFLATVSYKRQDHGTTSAITPNMDNGTIHTVQPSGANITFNAPTNPHTGMILIIQAQGKGASTTTTTWNAAYLYHDSNVVPASTASYRTWTFTYNGSGWIQIASF